MVSPAQRDGLPLLRDEHFKTEKERTNEAYYRNSKIRKIEACCRKVGLLKPFLVLNVVANDEGPGPNLRIADC